MGYIGGIETFRAWVKKLKNFSKVDKVSIEELLPLKGIADDTCPSGKKRCMIVEGLNVKDSSRISYMTLKLEPQ